MCCVLSTSFSWVLLTSEYTELGGDISFIVKICFKNCYNSDKTSWKECLCGFFKTLADSNSSNCKINDVFRFNDTWDHVFKAKKIICHLKKMVLSAHWESHNEHNLWDVAIGFLNPTSHKNHSSTRLNSLLLPSGVQCFSTITATVYFCYEKDTFELWWTFLNNLPHFLICVSYS